MLYALRTSVAGLKGENVNEFSAVKFTVFESPGFMGPVLTTGLLKSRPEGEVPLASILNVIATFSPSVVGMEEIVAVASSAMIITWSVC